LVGFLNRGFPCDANACTVANRFYFVVKCLHLFEVSNFVDVGLVLEVLTLLVCKDLPLQADLLHDH
jgi:hypothetical protein